MEETPYMLAVTAARSLLVDKERAIEGTATISLETQADMTENDFLVYAEEHLDDFLRIVPHLSNDDADLTLSYYLLQKTQSALAVVHRTTQTICSFLIRKAVERIGAYIMLGQPTEKIMSEILQEAGIEYAFGKSKAPLSRVAATYDRTRSFQETADRNELNRPDVRRVLRETAKTLEQSKGVRQRALGAYLHGMIDKAGAVGGISEKKTEKLAYICLSDPAILGRFVVNLDDPDWSACYFARANR